MPPPLAVFLWSRLLVWVTAIYAWVWFVPRPPQSRRTCRPRLRDEDLGPRGRRLVPRDRRARLPAERRRASSTRSTRLLRRRPRPRVRRVLRHAPASSSRSPAAQARSSSSTGSRSRDSASDGARRALLYLALFPMSLFLQAVYSESLYLLCCVGAFVLAETAQLARRRRRHGTRAADPPRRRRARPADALPRVALARRGRRGTAEPASWRRRARRSIRSGSS